MAVQWDTWNTADNLIKQGQESGPRLVVVCFAHKWNPPAMHSATALNTLRNSGRIPHAALVLLDADAEQLKCTELGYKVKRSWLMS